MLDQKGYLQLILRQMGVQNKEFFSFFTTYFSRINGYEISPEILQKEPNIKASKDVNFRVSGYTSIPFNTIFEGRENIEYDISSSGMLKHRESRDYNPYSSESLTIDLAERKSPDYSETVCLTTGEDVFHNGETHIVWTTEKKEDKKVVERVECRYFGPSKGAEIKYYSQQNIELMENKGNNAPLIPVSDVTDTIKPENLRDKEFYDLTIIYNQFVKEHLNARRK